MAIHYKTSNKMTKRHPKNHTHIKQNLTRIIETTQGTLPSSFHISLFAIPIISL